jgi:hypothetical protein
MARIGGLVGRVTPSVARPACFEMKGEASRLGIHFVHTEQILTNFP